MTTNLEYFLYRNGELSTEESGVRDPLGEGERIDLTFAAGGATLQLVAFQDPTYPSNPYPSAVVEGCGGLTVGYTEEVFSSNRAVGNYRYCRTNVDTINLDDLFNFPGGPGRASVVQPGTRLTYEIHFQNTDAEAVSTVVIRDTLPEELDITTIAFGSASHEYEAMIDGDRVLTITFRGIDLAGSSTDVPGFIDPEPASGSTNAFANQGVVSYSIDHMVELQRGDSWETSAAIFLDNRSPIFTRSARTIIAILPLLSSTRTVDFTATEIDISPNPVSDELRVTLPEHSPGDALLLSVYDAVGRHVRTIPYTGAPQRLSVTGLQNGTYVLLVSQRGAAIGRSRFVVTPIVTVP